MKINEKEAGNAPLKEISENQKISSIPPTRPGTLLTKITLNSYVIADGVDEEADVRAEERELDVHVDEAASVDDPEDGEQDESSGHESDENEAAGVADGHGRGLGRRSHRWDRPRCWCRHRWIFKDERIQHW